MKRILCMMLFITASFSAVEGAEQFQSTSRGFRIVFDLKKLRVENSAENYNQLLFDRAVQTGGIGEPMVPARVFLLGLPAGADAEVSLISSATRSFSNVNLQPVPELPEQSMGKLVYKKGEAYEAASWPESRLHYEILQMGSWRVLQITLLPAVYHAADKRLSVVTQGVIEVSFSGQQPWKRPDHAAKGMTQAFDNREQVMGWSTAEIERRPVRLSKTAAAGSWYKIPISEEGVYRISGQWLEDKGITLSDIAASTVKILAGPGRMLDQNPEVARRDTLMELPVSFPGDSDDIWQADEELWFYAKSLSDVDWTGAEMRHYNHIYDKLNVVWLVFNDEKPGKRITTVSEGSPDAGQQLTQSRDWIFAEQDAVNPIGMGTRWYGEEFRLSNNRQLVTLPFNAPVPYETMNFRVRVRGFSSGDHYLRMDLGSSNLGTAKAGANLDQETVFNWAGDPGGGPYSVDLTYSYGGSVSNPSAFLDWIEVEYTQSLSASDNNLRFYLPRESSLYTAVLSGFDSTPLVWDVTDFENIEAHDVTASGSDHQVALTGRIDQPRRFYAFTASGVKDPIDLEAAVTPSLRDNQSGANMVIVTHADFMASAQRLAEHRRQYSGLSVQVVDVARIYDEFAWGLVDVMAIRDYMRYALYNWDTPPEYLLLVGDGDYDSRNLELEEFSNWIPAFERSGLDHQSARATDDIFGYLDSIDIVMDVAVGRLPVRSASQAETVVNKIISTENEPQWGAWRRLITLVGDDEITPRSTTEVRHTVASERLADEFIPARFETKKIFLGEYATEYTGNGRRKPTANEAIKQQINDGTLWINYIGHSHHLLWSDEWVFHIDIDFADFDNDPRYPLVYSASCSFAKFDELYIQSAAERLLTTQGRGALAVIAASRDCSPHYNEALNAAFMKMVLEGDLPVGKALQAAKASMGSYSFANNEMYMIMGDPAMHLPLPRHEAVLTSILPDSIKALSVIEVQGEVRNGGALWSDFNGHVTLEANDARRERDYQFDGGVINYDLAGNALFRGEAKVTDGRFSTAFVVPKDISYGAETGRITCYFWNDTTDGVGYRYNLPVGGSSAIEDTEGPELDIYFSGQEDFVDGDMAPMPAELVMVIADEATGVNITGEIGHKITIALDGGQPVEVTDRFSYDEGSYLAGKVFYPLETVDEGRHDIQVKAWDNANNSSSKSLSFELVRGDKLRIENVLNYPNPVEESTHFTFRMSHEAEIEIKIYTVSGRLIRHLEHIDGEAGFNMVPWDGLDQMGDRPANGVYLYKIFAKSLWEETSLKKEVLGRLIISR